MEGTDNPVDLILYGDKGHSQPVIIGGAENFSFSKGQVDVFDVSPVVVFYFCIMYSRTCLKQPLKKQTKNCFFQDSLSLNAGQKYCRMLQGEHSTILLTCI